MKYWAVRFLCVGALCATAYAAQAAAVAPFPERDLFYGIMQDSLVSSLQTFLTEQQAYDGPITGNFLSLTQEGVKRFQAREQISPAAGYFGPKTRTRANQIIAGLPESADAGKTPAADGLQAKIALLQSQVAALQAQIGAQSSATPISASNTSAVPMPAAPIPIPENLPPEAQQALAAISAFSTSNLDARAVFLNKNPDTALLSAKTYTLSWSSENASHCVAEGAWSGIKAVSGTEDIPLVKRGASAYILACGNFLSVASQTLTLFIQ